MSHKLHDISLYYPEGADIKVRRTFNKKAKVISDLYVHYLNSYKPPKTTRVSVELGRPEIKLIGFAGSVLCLNYPFDAKQYWELSNHEQNQYLLAITHEVGVLCCKEFNWDLNVFNAAHQRVIEANFVYEVELKQKLSKDKKIKACLIVNKIEGCAIISAGFFNKEGRMLKKVELFRAQQHETFYGHALKKHKWIHDHYGITGCDEEVQILASPYSDERVVKFYPNKHSQRKLEKFVNFLTYKEINTSEEFEAWLKE